LNYDSAPTIRRINAVHLDAVGLTPKALAVIVAVMAFERCFGCSPRSREVRALLGVDDLQLNELTKGLWLTAEGQKNGNRVLTARPRAWSELGFKRDELRRAG